MSESPQLSGCYRIISETKYQYLKVVDGKVTHHAAGQSKPYDRIKIEYGEFGQVHPKIEEITGKRKNNFKLIISWNKENDSDTWEIEGLVTDDGERLYYKKTHDPNEIDIHARISQAEADEIDADEGDPIDAPPGPYKIQPEYQGRLVWLTGPPGTGKSTTAQLLGRLKGYVYYEVDCFRGLRNPYIPLDVPNPTMAQDSQRHLTGEGKEERKAVCEKAVKWWEKTLFKKETPTDEDEAACDDLMDLLAENILSERRRIGGDWVVAGCLCRTKERNRIRSKFGQDILMVHLQMSEEDVTKRLAARHAGNEKSQEILMVNSK